MTPTPLPTNRSLVHIDPDSLISQDAKNRVREESKRKFFWSNILATLQLHRNYLVVFTGGLAVIFAVTFKPDALLTAGLIIPAVWFIGRFLNKEKGRAYIDRCKAIEFPCPHCDTFTDLSAVWTCENCKTQNNQTTVEFCTPFDGCKGHGCSKQQQTAYECPHCHKHVVLDEAGYRDRHSNQHPYRGVARYLHLHDKSVPPVTEPTQFFHD